MMDAWCIEEGTLAKWPAGLGGETLPMGGVWPHRTIGFAAYIIGVSMSIYASGLTPVNIPWIVMGFGMSMFGAELPDFDDYRKGKDSLITHRSAITHSPLIPLLVFLVAWIFAPGATLVIVSPLLALFLVGHASHILLDVLPGDKKEGPAGEVSKTAKKKKRKKTFYSLHLPGIATYDDQARVLLVAFGIIEAFLGLWASNAVSGLQFGWH